MSVKRILEGKSSIDKEFQEIIKSIIPKKEQFKTLSGSKAFSKYPIIASGDQNNSYEASLVGTAFDYLARAMIANVLVENKEHSTLGYKSFSGLERIRILISDNDYNLIYTRYTQALTNFIDYIYSGPCLLPKPKKLFKSCKKNEWDAWGKYIEKAGRKDFIEKESIFEIIDDALFFAKLEHIYRSGGILPQEGISSLLCEFPKHLKEDLTELCKAFMNNFVEVGLVQRDSKVIFNPSFGITSYACRGADADVYIDGTLYDFKSGKNTGYKWQEIAQLTAYFLLDIVSCGINDPDKPSDLKDFEICNIAFYRARFGEIEYINTELFNTDEFEEKLDLFADHLFDRLSNLPLNN